MRKFLPVLFNRLMVSDLKHKYIQPSIKVIAVDIWTPILEDSMDEWENESPVPGGRIGDDE